MRIKRHLSLTIQRGFLYIKGLGISAFTPLFVIYILFPVLCVLSYNRYGISDITYSNIIGYAQVLLPMSSVWWMIFILRQFVDSPACEILSVIKNRIRLFDLLRLFFTAFINIVIVFIPLIRDFPNMKLELVRIFFICVLYFGFVYFISYLTKSLTVTVMSVLCYTLAGYLLYQNKMMFPLYFTFESASFSLILGPYARLAIIGIVMTLIGLILNRFRKIVV